MKRFVIGFSLVLAIAAVSVMVARADAPWRGGWHHHGPLGYMARELDLTSTQKSQIRTIWQQQKPAVASLVRELAADNKEMDAATAQGKLDESKVQDIAARQGATIAKLLVEKEQIRSQIYTSVLNADQRAKADKMQERWSSRFDRIASRLEQSNSTQMQ